jgi:hypothetical protein
VVQIFGIKNINLLEERVINVDLDMRLQTVRANGDFIKIL